MRIKKISPTTPANGNIENQYGTSQTNAYSEAYVNTTFASKNIENYSTTETVVGKWIDGKPIYRKVVQGSLTLSPQTWVDTGIVDNTIDLLINTKSFYAGANTAVLEISANRTSDSRIEVLSTLSTTTYPTAILLEYTKTTD